MNSNLKENILSLRPSCIYGLGTTGMSVVNFIRKRNVFKYYGWDDYLVLKKKIKKLPFMAWVKPEYRLLKLLKK